MKKLLREGSLHLQIRWTQSATLTSSTIVLNLYVLNNNYKLIILLTLRSDSRNTNASFRMDVSANAQPPLL